MDPRIRMNKESFSVWAQVESNKASLQERAAGNQTFQVMTTVEVLREVPKRKKAQCSRSHPSPEEPSSTQPTNFSTKRQRWRLRSSCFSCYTLSMTRFASFHVHTNFSTKRQRWRLRSSCFSCYTLSMTRFASFHVHSTWSRRI